MGFEARVDSVVEEMAPHLTRRYWWSDGLNVADDQCGIELCDLLSDSDEIILAPFYSEVDMKVYFIRPEQVIADMMIGG